MGIGFGSSLTAEDDGMGISPYQAAAKAFAPTPGAPSGLTWKAKAPNPNPKNFKIIWYAEVQAADGVDTRTVMEVEYPDCTNFEGRKILVYRCPKEAIVHAEELDPHFNDSVFLSPMARFEPTKTGISHAMAFAKNMASGVV